MKKEILYISPNKIKENSASSIHILNMCNAAYDLNYDITLISSSDNKLEEVKTEIKKFYGEFKFKLFSINNFFLNKGNELIITFFLIYLYLFKFINIKNKYIISRNLYTAFFISFFLKKRVIYETHIVEKYFRSYLQSKIILKNNNTTICISDVLKDLLIKRYNINNNNNIYTLHDSANIINLSKDLINNNKNKIFNNLNIPRKYKLIGYFGGLYKGRGMELIVNLSYLKKDCFFLVFGGDIASINYWKNKIQTNNLIFMGNLKYSDVGLNLKSMDILLMPYQKKVYLSTTKTSTAEWMSPLKMFEYMSSNVPFISSKLKVLQEILVHNHNCLLAEPDKIDDWSKAIDRLKRDSNLANLISSNSYHEFKNNHTWQKRLEKIINFYDNTL